MIYSHKYDSRKVQRMQCSVCGIDFLSRNNGFLMCKNCYEESVANSELLVEENFSGAEKRRCRWCGKKYTYYSDEDLAFMMEFCCEECMYEYISEKNNPEVGEIPF